MVQRYLKLEPFLDNDEYEEIEGHILSSCEIWKAKWLCEISFDLNLITKELQKDDINLSTIRDLFRFAMESYELSENYLSENGRIILQPDFENALVKILDKKLNEMSL